MKRLRIISTLTSFLLLGLVIWTSTAQAGLHDDETGATYIEIWADHQYFTGGCGSHSSGGFDWYLEPCGGRSDSKQVTITLPDDLTKVSKIELYADLWNTRAPEDVRYAINDGVEHISPVASHYGRVPMIVEIAKAEFQTGANTIDFWYQPPGFTYHVHDISVRLYYDPADPPLSGLGDADAMLSALDAGDGPVDPAAGGTLLIDSDQISITVTAVSTDVDFVEIYAYYDGYDEDNIGGAQDWHSRGRHNCHQGGAGGLCPTDPETSQYGTIDHVGTIDTRSGGPTWTHIWEIPWLEAQSGVRFKLRAVDIDVDVNGDGNVTAADDGDNSRNHLPSAPFTLQRSYSVVTFSIPDFQSAFLQRPDSLGQSVQPLTTDRYINLPNDLADFDTAYMFGSHFNGPLIAFNNNSQVYAFGSGEDNFALSIITVPIGQLQAGANKISYEATRTYPNGNFIEPPGPMIVLKRSSAPGADNTAPWVHQMLPAMDAIDQPIDVGISAQIYDSNSGVDPATIVMEIDDGSGFAPITHTLAGGINNYSISYQPATDFTHNQVVSVRVTADDLDGNTASETWSFTTVADFVPSDVVSDDFNQCELNTSLWQFVNPVGDSSYTMAGDSLELLVPEGASHDLWNGASKGAPRMIQPIANGNFDIEIKFDSIFDQVEGDLMPYQLQGLIAGENTAGNSGNFVRFDSQFTPTGVQLFWQVFENGGAVGGLGGAFGTGIDPQTPPPYLRIERENLTWKLYFSYSGTSWTKVSEFTRNMNVTEVGFFGGNAANNPEHVAIVDYFFNREDPIDPEDSEANILPVTIVGTGMVESVPECGNPVTLAATTEPGWEFAGWSGVINSTNPQEVVSFDQDDTVTATFDRLFYALDAVAVDKNGTPTAMGSVSQTLPIDAQGYVYSETVTLDVEAEEGWRFIQWQGDLSGADHPISFPMTSSLSIEALFLQEFSLEMQTVGNGGITAAQLPTEERYLDGASFDLTAVADPGWQFVGWSGDASGAEPITPLVMDADKSVYAHFMQLDTEGSGSVVIQTVQSGAPGEMEITLAAAPASGWGLYAWEVDGVPTEADPADLTLTTDLNQAKAIKALFKRLYTLTITTDANGEILAAPSAAVYFEGETVRLTPVAKDGFAFVGWLGDLAPNNLTAPIDVVMDADLTATARFIEGFGITIFKEGSGGVLQEPNQPPFLFGDTVTLEAIPLAGWEFGGWSGDVVSSANPVDITMNSSKVVTATFTAIAYAVTVDILPVAEAGSVTMSSASPYAFGDNVTLTAQAANGWRFVRWDDASASTDPVISLTINEDKHLRAIFEATMKELYLPLLRR